MAAPVSVVIPCFNGEPYLAEAIRSVLDQSLPPVEVIVVNDGSTDASPAIARSFGGIVRVIDQDNRGESVARNVGTRAAQAPYILFLDADDLLAEESIERLAGAVQAEPDAVALMGHVLFRERPTNVTERHLPGSQRFLPGILRTNFGPPHVWLTPRRLVLQVGGFREDLTRSEDWEFWARIALTGARLLPIPYPGALYRQHERSQVSSTPRPEVLLGRVRVGETLGRGMLERNDLLRTYGADLFWALWALRHQATEGRVPVAALRTLDGLIEQVAGRLVVTVRWRPFPLAVRLLGIDRADLIRTRLRPGDRGIHRHLSPTLR
jgi:hypothetical protein